MLVPTIQTDGKLTMVVVGNATYWFSYKTLVAFRVGAVKVVHKNVWSNTTGKHLNEIDGGDTANRVDTEEFERRLKELVGA